MSRFSLLPLWALARRDLRQQASYGLATLLRLFSITVGVLVFYYLARLVDAGPLRVRGGYFAFYLLGTSLASLLTLGIRGFAQEIRDAQLAGTLEILFLSPLSPWELALWGSLWSLGRNLAGAVTYVIVGSLLGLGSVQPAWGATVLVVLASVFAFAPLGVLAAAYVILWKKGDPISFALGAASSLVAGVYFPLRLLPGWLQSAARLFPLTHAVRALRGAFIEGEGITTLAPSLGILVAFGVVLGPLSLLVFERAVAAAKRSGSLGQY